MHCELCSPLTEILKEGGAFFLNTYSFNFTFEENEKDQVTSFTAVLENYRSLKPMTVNQSLGIE